MVLSTDEDQGITFSADDLLSNTTDVKAMLSISDITYSGDDGDLVDNGDGTFYLHCRMKTSMVKSTLIARYSMAPGKVTPI
ncbi:cadherin-like domain-containing protein [Vibrio lentus]|nr:cadherin-like domain-containing protein [Vibrio lentus]